MINNRQSGRRRGRGGQRSQGGPGRPDNGNRIDNRARGNAAQLLEKYKSLARDAQMQGDRVNTEYYLQFADHYFRVLNENRSRFEEQQARRGAFDAFEGDEDEEFESESFAGEEQGGSGRANFEREARPEREPRQERDAYQGQGRFRRDGTNGNGAPRGPMQANGAAGGSSTAPANGPVNGSANGYSDSDGIAQRPVRAESAPGENGSNDAMAERPRRGRPRRAAPVDAAGEDAPAAFDADRLPPALGVSEDAAGEDEAPRPRRRRTRSATEPDTAS